MKHNFFVYVFALCIPLLLIVDTYQSAEYAKLEKEVLFIQGEEHDLIEANKRLLSGISVLSNPERIEKIARDTLGMRKADLSEIIRVEIKRQDNGTY